MIIYNYLLKLKQLPLEAEDEGFAGGRGGEEEVFPTLRVQQEVAAIIQPFFTPEASEGPRSSASPAPSAPGTRWQSPAPSRFRPSTSTTR
jgi:hypothetical protein